MSPTATSTEANPTHHLTLSAGGTTYGIILVRPGQNEEGEPILLASPSAISRTPMSRTSTKFTQGQTQYTDFEQPYTPIAQDDWSGGRANENFDRDSTRFFDSYRANTWHEGQILLGPQETYCTGHRDSDSNMPGSVTWQALTGSQRYLAYKFDDSAAYSADRAFVWVRKVGTPNGVLTLEICADNAGDPGAVAKTVTLAVADGPAFQSEFVEFDWATTTAFSGSGTYHIKVYGASGDDATNHWAVGVNNASGVTQQSSDNSSWASASVDLYFRIVDADVSRISRFYEYKGALYFATHKDSDAAGQVFVNGDRGVANGTQAAGILIDDTKSWTTNEWANCVVKIMSGGGKGQYRTIASNDGDTLTLGADWDITPTDTDSEYVILASNAWTERATTGLTKGVTDVLPVNDIVYFAQNDGTNIRRMREYNNAGTWTIQYDDDGTNQGVHLQYTNHPEDGIQVWKSNNTDDADKSVARADVAAWATDLSFGTAIPVGDRRELINGLERYGSPELLWVLKEGSLWQIDQDVAEAVPLREMENVTSEYNGVAHVVHGVYLYFSLLHSLERFYRNNLDDIGPSREAGLPSNRQGPVVALVGYPGMFFAAIDGDSNYSSVLVNNGLGWHELYRAPKGERIRNIYFQVIPGSTVDRLWISQGNDIVWLPFPSNTFDPYRDSNYRYTHEATITSAWHYMKMQDVQKFFKSLKLFCENVTASAQVVEAEYQTDGSSTWTAINGTFDTVPVEEVDFSSTNAANGRRLRYRLRLNTNDNTKTPKVTAAVVEALGRIDVKYSYSFTFAARDENLDLEGDDDSYTTVQTLVNQLNTWATSTTPLTMRTVFSPYDNKTVFIDPASYRPHSIVFDDQLEAHIGNMTVYEI
jgi:hypothetical protein